METARLKQFKVVVETGSLRKAAQLLNLSHGGLSKSIKALENELGTQLIAPDGRGIRITERGLQVYESTRELLRQVETLLNPAIAPAHAIPRLSLGTSELFSTYFLETLLSHTRGELRVYLRELLPAKMERALLERSIDIALTYLPIPANGIEFMKVGTMRMGIFTAVGAFSNIPLCELPFAVPIDRVMGSPTDHANLDGWPQSWFRRKAAFEVTLMESALQLCRHGRAAVYLPHFLASLSNESCAANLQLEPRSLPDSAPVVTLDIYLATRQGYLENDFIRRIAKAVRIGVKGSNWPT